MRKLQLKTMLLMLLMAVGGLSPAWAEAGDVTVNADIDFSNAITGTNPYTINGTVGKMTWTQQWTMTPNITDGILRFGNTNGQEVELVNNNIRSKDQVTIKFDMAFGKLTGKHVGFQLVDADGNSLLQQWFDAYNGDFDDANPLNLDWSKMYRGSNEVIQERCVYFTIVFDYAAKKVYTTTKCYLSGTGKAATDGAFEADWASTAAIAKFVLQGNINNAGRYSTLDNLKITTTEGDYSAATANYTVKYVDGNDNSIKDDAVYEGDVDADAVITNVDKANFTLDDGSMRYIYVSDDAEGKKIAEDGSTVVTVVFREANKYNYTIKSAYSGVDLPFTSTGDVWEDLNSVRIHYPRYQASETTLVGLAPVNNNLYKDYIITEDDFTQTLDYTATDVTNLYLLSEAEDLEGTGLSKSATTFTDRVSNKQIIHGASANLLNLPAGKYIFTLGAIGGDNNTHKVEYVIYKGDKDDENKTEIGRGQCTGNYLTLISSDEFSLTENTTISMTCSDASSGRGIDLVYVQKTGDYDASDITNLITNPSFETGNLDGWTAERTDGDTGVKTNVSPYTTEGIDGSYLFNTWNGDATGYGITQTLTALPAGYYKLEADFAGLIGSKVDLIAGDMTTTVTHTATGVFTTAEVLFHNAEAADVIIGTTNATGWYKVDNFRLHTITAEQYLAPIIAEYQDLRTTASTIAAMESGISTAYKTIAANAIAECDALNPSDESGYRTAIGALQKAIETAQKSIDAYNMIAAGTIPTDNAAGWNKTTTNGTLACNTSSTEGNSDGSGMTTPFIQNWVGAGNPLGEGQLSYTLEGLEPGEKYNVSALVRVFNEAEGSLEGASFFANNQSIDVDAEGNACTGDYATKGIYGTFTAKAVEVGEDGTLTFGIAIADGSLLNWVAIKNVTISEYANQKVESITLSQSSATITTGDVLTLTATVLPENADDKTYTWTSSDETVATVSAAGVVSALKAGTTTITATANDGSEVSGSCEITVADAPALANVSPVDNGVFYIRNVATGKFLGQGNSWDTQASLIKHGKPVTVALSEGKYTFKDIVKSGAGLGSDCYVDNGTAAALTITETSEGSKIYTIAYENNKLAAYVGTTGLGYQDIDAANTMAQWQFISLEDMKKNLQSTGDATFFLTGALAQRTAASNSAWTSSNVTTDISGNLAWNNAYICSESYHKDNFSYTQTITVPNGTYTVSVQGFNSGNAEANFVANEKSVAMRAQNSESHGMTCNSRTSAAKVFEAGYYYNTIENVVVSDHTLTIGVSGSSANSWVAWNNFELYLTEYVPVTEITANIDKTEITEGSTATISNIATVPAAASFNAYTISSDNEEVATVTPAGVVTAIKAGTANITIAAEMENVTKVFAITVVEPVAAPESIALKNGEEAAADMILHGSTLTATLTAKVLPEDAPQAVDWVSSDESVATVLNGVITAVSTGEATITARSVEDTNISASINVKVYMFLNNSFEADGNQAAGNGTNPNIITITGWTQEQNSAGSYQDNQLRDANTDNASNYGKKVTPSDGNYYFFYRHGWNGSNYAKLTSEAQTLPVGKYTLSVDYKMVSGSDNANNNDNTAITLSAISGENTLGTVTKNDATKANDNSSTAYLTNEAWKTATTTFTLEESKSVQAVINLMACGPKRSDFVIDNVTLTWSSFKDALNDAIAEANEVDVTTNVGTAAFQIPTAAATTFTSAISDAQGVYDDAESEETDYLNAIKALATATSTWENSELNEPDAEKLYNIVVSTTGHAKVNNPIIVIPGATSANNPTGYALNANFAGNTNLSQAFTFTKVEGNNYKISAKVGGVDVYLTNGSLNGSAAGWKDSQIQATTDVEKAMAFKIAVSTTEGSFNIYNTVTNSTIACQSGGNIYTEAGNADFSVVETTKPSIEINTTAAGWGTVMLPFAQELPAEVKAYTCAEVSEDKLTIIEVNALEANKPYLIEGAWDETVTGDAQGTALNYTEGLFTGVYEATAAPVGSYVLQNKNEKLGFYRVAEGKQPTVKANRAYLTVEAASARDAFFFGEGETTAISMLKALSEGTVEIYSLNGVKQSKLQKGTNILKMSDGSIRKVMVK